MKALENSELTETHNGASAYKTSGSKLVDLNFSVPSLRNAAIAHYGKKQESYFYYGEESLMTVGEALRLALDSFAEDPMYTWKWLMYARHIKLGLGERDVFRMILTKFSNVEPELTLRFITGTELWNYGRWDDVLRIYFDTESEVVEETLGGIIVRQFERDVRGAEMGDAISLLAKWMPSNNTSSKAARAEAILLQGLLALSSKEYRQTLSKLRKHLEVVDRKASLQEWSEIDYERVPSKANLKYRNAFLAHDEERRRAYLDSLVKGDVKINSNAAFLYDIVSAYRRHNAVDATLEEMWKSQVTVGDLEDVLVIRDGSGSMCSQVSSNSHVTAMDVADSIALYCASHNTNPVYRGKFITFSSRPRFVDVSKAKTLRGKLNILEREDDCSNTDLEKTFQLILRTAIKYQMKQSDLPKACLIISDMQFDDATYHVEQETLMEGIAKRYREYGYEVPKLIFWNVSCYAHNTVPLQQHPTGVILVSGFSKSIVDMVMSGELDPEKALKAELDSKFSIVDRIFEEN